VFCSLILALFSLIKITLPIIFVYWGAFGIFTAAALSHAQRLGMGKLIPDRFFWARDVSLKS
jgi:hypothetical protein